METVAGGWGEGRPSAPNQIGNSNALGRMPPDALVKLADSSFARSLAAAGCSPALWDDSDGTSKREALRQWHLGTVQPLARLLEFEATEKLETDVRLKFDLYNTDLAGRAMAFQSSWRAASP